MDSNKLTDKLIKKNLKKKFNKQNFKLNSFSRRFIVNFITFWNKQFMIKIFKLFDYISYFIYISHNNKEKFV